MGNNFSADIKVSDWDVRITETCFLNVIFDSYSKFPEQQCLLI